MLIPFLILIPKIKEGEIALVATRDKDVMVWLFVDLDPRICYNIKDSEIFIEDKPATIESFLKWGCTPAKNEIKSVWKSFDTKDIYVTLITENKSVVKAYFYKRLK